MSFQDTLGEGSYSTEYAIKILDKNHLIRKDKMLVTLAEKDILIKLGSHEDEDAAAGAYEYTAVMREAEGGWSSGLVLGAGDRDKKCERLREGKEKEYDASKDCGNVIESAEPNGEREFVISITYSAETSAVSTIRVEKALVHSAHLQTWAQAWRLESKCNTTPSS
ncbi:uncharacterized protein HD556DRAFT_1448996 [Suillus plorans]|uniref:Uncharacterized protein n=1 Tax=Suillus plorans TaxID=116603 RepID=A0A9P7AF63_9AGAM|nr:uncharacterized protein HD556DRAFT_1448996 [Suillus plorans]KAG1787200.1 hypothetical protein HD556DRAFT_1448996 [Suillus plorans]